MSLIVFCLQDCKDDMESILKNMFSSNIKIYNKTAQLCPTIRFTTIN